ncbi:MAG: hypothetical protein Q6373_022590 [Candidatus Sigynarchaeota archaeon]
MLPRYLVPPALLISPAYRDMAAIPVLQLERAARALGAARGKRSCPTFCWFP